jgi:3-oxoacyl-[acyl-carrier-protein] synthase-3
MIPTAQRFAADGLARHGESLDDYAVVLPHMSSFYFRDQMEQIIAGATSDGRMRPYWTNLATAGNTGAASIYIMLDEYLEQHPPRDGDRIMLFVPESGQFNFVMISLTAVRR